LAGKERLGWGFAFLKKVRGVKRGIRCKKSHVTFAVPMIRQTQTKKGRKIEITISMRNFQMRMEGEKKK